MLGFLFSSLDKGPVLIRITPCARLEILIPRYVGPDNFHKRSAGVSGLQLAVEGLLLLHVARNPRYPFFLTVHV